PWTRPRTTSIVIGITPQWPLVVTAVRVQAPSKRGALAAGKLESTSIVAVALLRKKRRPPFIELLLLATEDVTSSKVRESSARDRRSATPAPPQAVEDK